MSGLCRVRWLPVTSVAIFLTLSCAPGLAGQVDSQQFLVTAIQNTLHDAKELRNFVFQQKIHSTRNPQAGPAGIYRRTLEAPSHLEVVLETVVAEGKVYQRRIELNGKPVPEQEQRREEMEQRGDFATILLFGVDTPFEDIPALFKIASRHEDQQSGKMALELNPETPEAKSRATQIKLEIDSGKMRVTAAHYVRRQQNHGRFYIEQTTDCTFGAIRA